MEKQISLEELAVTLDGAFKYKIGDIVMHATVSSQVQPYPPTIGPLPQPLYVIERHAQQCYGGVQLWYTVRGSNLSQFERLVEHEIIPFVPRDLVAERAEVDRQADAKLERERESWMDRASRRDRSRDTGDTTPPADPEKK